MSSAWADALAAGATPNEAGDLLLPLDTLQVRTGQYALHGWARAMLEPVPLHRRLVQHSPPPPRNTPDVVTSVPGECEEVLH